MASSTPYFKDVPEYGDLHVDYILVDYVYHLLFTLKNNNGNYFICTCFDTRGSQQWLLSPIPVKGLLDLLQNRIPIKAAFLETEKTMHVELNYETREEVFTVIPKETVPAEWLPTAGEYLNPDPNEYDDYVKILTSK